MTILELFERLSSRDVLVTHFETKADRWPSELCDQMPEGNVQDFVLCCLALFLIEFETLELVDALAGAVVDIAVELLKSTSTFQ